MLQAAEMKLQERRSDLILRSMLPPGSEGARIKSAPPYQILSSSVCPSTLTQRFHCSNTSATFGDQQRQRHG